MIIVTEKTTIEIISIDNHSYLCDTFKTKKLWL